MKILQRKEKRKNENLEDEAKEKLCKNAEKRKQIIGENLVDKVKKKYQYRKPEKKANS